MILLEYNEGKSNFTPRCHDYLGRNVMGTTEFVAKLQTSRNNPGSGGNVRCLRQRSARHTIRVLSQPPPLDQDVDKTPDPKRRPNKTKMTAPKQSKAQPPQANRLARMLSIMCEQLTV